jgi:four helix bundle protein
VGVRTLEELRAWQLANEFKLEVYRLVDGCPAATADFRFKSQIFDAVDSNEACIAEGFRRFYASEFRAFLRYARASLAEAEVRLKSGIARRYFDAALCRHAFELSEKSGKTTVALYNSLERFVRKRGKPNDRKRPKRRPPKPRRTQDPGPRTHED